MTPAEQLALHAAATALRLKLWPRGVRHEFHGAIGVGDGILHVYLHTDRHPQHEEPFAEFHGHHVAWHYIGDVFTGHRSSVVVVDDLDTA